MAPIQNLEALYIILPFILQKSDLPTRDAQKNIKPWLALFTMNPSPLQQAYLHGVAFFEYVFFLFILKFQTLHIVVHGFKKLEKY